MAGAEDGGIGISRDRGGDQKFDFSEKVELLRSVS
jgi:hypothetical protein